MRIFGLVLFWVVVVVSYGTIIYDLKHSPPSH